MNFKSAYSGSLYYHYIPTVSSNGTEYRHCFSSWEVGSFGYAVWGEERRNGRVFLERLPEFKETRVAANKLAQSQSDMLRKRVSPCTYHQVTIGKSEFAGSMIKESYRTLRKCILAQGQAQADFVIAFQRDFYQISFRAINPTVEKIMLLLKLNGVISTDKDGDRIVEHDGRLQDLPGYKP